MSLFCNKQVVAPLDEVFKEFSAQEVEEEGSNHTLIICYVGSFLMIQDIRRKFIKEPLASFILMGCFIDIPSLAFGCDV